MIIDNYFRQYYLRLTSTAPELKHIQKIQHQASAALKQAGVPFQNLTLIGSCAKNVLLGRPSSPVVDMLCLVEPDVLASTGNSLLEKTRSCLQNRPDLDF